MLEGEGSGEQLVIRCSVNHLPLNVSKTKQLVVVVVFFVSFLFVCLFNPKRQQSSVAVQRPTIDCLETTVAKY